MIVAVMYGRVEMARVFAVLIRKGADVNQMFMCNKWSLFMPACFIRNMDICRLLLENGADVTQQAMAQGNVRYSLQHRAATCRSFTCCSNIQVSKLKQP